MLSDIIKLTDGPIKYEMYGDHIKMTTHKVPLSIKQAEWDYLHNVVVSNNLQRGFEVATAFGISGIAIGTAFKKTGGKFVTMDAYIEEMHNDAGTYEKFERRVYDESDGYKSVKYLIDRFDVADNMIAEIGWSPDDVETILKRNFGDKKLDFVFLDAGHFEHQMIKDITEISKHLDEKFVFVFHDIYPWSCTQNVHDCIFQTFGKKVEIVVPHPAGENMGVIVNL
jgi:predicted O-methyltransferase YrrM